MKSTQVDPDMLLVVPRSRVKSRARSEAAGRRPRLNFSDGPVRVDGIRQEPKRRTEPGRAPLNDLQLAAGYIAVGFLFYLALASCGSNAGIGGQPVVAATGVEPTQYMSTIHLQQNVLNADKTATFAVCGPAHGAQNIAPECVAALEKDANDLDAAVARVRAIAPPKCLKAGAVAYLSGLEDIAKGERQTVLALRQNDDGALNSANGLIQQGTAKLEPAIGKLNLDFAASC